MNPTGPPSPTTRMTTESVLTSDERNLLEAVAASAELQLVAARRVRADAGPGGVTVCYELTLGDHTGGRIDRLVYVETSPASEVRPGVLQLRDPDGDERAVWVYPNDPYLPALVDAVVPTRAAALLRSAGLVEVPDAPSLEVRAYRPGKRAVVRASWGDTTVYLKVVPPAAAQDIADRHADWIAAGLPVPRVLGVSPRGLVVLENQHGTPVTEVLARVDPDALLDSIATLRSRIAGIASEASARTSLATRFSWYRRKVRALAPELEPELDALRDAVAEGLAQEVAPATIHGDLHVGQLFVDPDAPERVIGVIDLDTAGLGDPADDDAALWAHLIATAAFARGHGDEVNARAAEALAEVAQRRWPVDSGRQAAIAATHLLGHALTTTLTPQAAVARARHLLAHERPLIAASFSPHER